MSTQLSVSEALRSEVEQELLSESPTTSTSDLGRHVSEMLDRRAPLLSELVRAELVHGMVADLSGYGPLELLLTDPTVTEVMVNGAHDVWVERAGRLVRVPLHLDEHTILRIIERIIAPLGLHLDRSRPMVDARLPDGSRINAIVAPLSLNGPCLTIRRFGTTPMTLGNFGPPNIVSALCTAVRERLNIVVSGGTGAGKTTLLNALCHELPSTDRVITIEDAAELRLSTPHVVRLEARPASTEGAGAITIRDLVRNALRMRPDRLIIGEVRGGEALDMLQALNTGHAGSLTTVHANSAEDALRRLEVMVLLAGIDLPMIAIRQQMMAAIHLVVHVGRSHHGLREVREICRVVDSPTGPHAEPVAV